LGERNKEKKKKIVVGPAGGLCRLKKKVKRESGPGWRNVPAEKNKKCSGSESTSPAEKRNKNICLAKNMPPTDSARCSIDRAGCAGAGWAGCP
jgi:hypothetical protein